METILESVPFYLTILSTVCGGITAALLGGITIWTFRDIRSRSRDVLAHILATVLVLDPVPTLPPEPTPAETIDPVPQA